MRSGQITIGMLALLMALIGAPATEAAPVQWTVGSGGNDHYYDVIQSTLTWTSAKSAAAASTYSSLTGHLGTITSQTEHDFIGSLLGTTKDGWIGFTDAPGEAPGASENNFRWITGETVTFTAWNSGEPNNCCGGEHYTHMFSITSPAGWRWNDLTVGATRSYYVVEFEASGVPNASSLAVVSLGVITLLAFGLRRTASSG